MHQSMARSTTHIGRARRIVPALVLALVAAGLTVSPASAAVSNDMFANAKVAGTLPYSDSLNNLEATEESFEDGCVNHSVWYRYNATAATTLRVDTNGSNFDTAFAVYEGATRNVVTGCVDELSTSGGEQRAFVVAAGKTYYVRVGSGGAATGSLVFHLRAHVPAHDYRQFAKSIGSLPFSDSLNNAEATKESGENACVGHSVWYRYVASTTTTLRVDTVGSNFDTAFVVYEGPAANTDVTGCVDDGSSAGGEQRALIVTSGRTYFIRVGSAANGTGSLVFHLKAHTPAHDFRQFAKQISSLPYADSLNNSDATKEGFENSCVGRSVWYRFNATATTTLKVDTNGSNFDTAFVVYEGPAANTDITGCVNDGGNAGGDQRQFQVVSGRTYHIRVGSGASATGTLVLHVKDMTIRKPDGRIRLGDGAFAGDNVYNTSGDNQARTGAGARRSTITFTVSIQNDGTATDRFMLQASGADTTSYIVRYYKGTTEVSTAVMNGSFQTDPVAAGAAALITVKVKVRGSAPAGSSVTRLVTISSVNDSTRKDAVKLTGKRE